MSLNITAYHHKKIWKKETKCGEMVGTFLSSLFGCVSMTRELHPLDEAIARETPPALPQNTPQCSKAPIKSADVNEESSLLRADDILRARSDSPPGNTDWRANVLLD